MTVGDPLGDVLLIIAPLGLAGVFIVTLLERVVPVMPSQGIFAAIGVAAADGLWCLPTAMAASVAGGGAGAFAAYSLGVSVAGRHAGSARVRRLLFRRDRVGRYLRKTRSASTALPFTAQLLPGARLVAPLVSGIMVQDKRRLVVPVLAGLAVWNTTFMLLGYAMVRLTGSSNATSITIGFAMLVLAAFLAKPLAARCRDLLGTMAVIRGNCRAFSPNLPTGVRAD